MEPLNTNPHDYHILILAAGFSRRFGTPKQELKWGDKSLLEHVTEVAMQTPYLVHIALGHEANALEKLISHLHVNKLLLRNYGEGMGSSLAEAIEKIISVSQPINGIILLLSDQPFINPSHLFNLVKNHKETGKSIVTEFKDKEGPPTLFDKSLFNEIMNLTGDQGAKKILQNNSDQLLKLRFEKAAIDIDTAEDYDIALNELKHHK